MRRVSQETEKREVRKRQRWLKAYEIAKEIAEFSDAYWEAMMIIDYVKENFEWGKKRGKAELLPYPVDNWGKKVEMPGAEAPSTNEN